MENIGSYVKWTIATIGGLLTGLLGGWDVALKVLVLFVVLDYITGLTAAWYEKRLNSDVGLKGIAKKILLFVPVAVGYWLDIALGTEVLRSLAIFFYIANEGLSILENLSRAGVAVPAPLKAALEQLKEKQGGAAQDDGSTGA
ncbi:holin, Cph1 family [Thermanaeromonas toyohensis ToBE]|uniref:Holin, Cph1 family n=1 Tax=Thermanaeromonas toyohensis ToBE TaxID=698762 RepID=A0A1W1VYK4_9FIRM|nr:phage holin family protein [Thermanaeromonas toyohensis]SMB97924.1 holin, Cph1 family [Thermanaeromonas toyohensis ToBE]